MIKFTTFLGNLALSTSLCVAMDSITLEIVPHPHKFLSEVSPITSEIIRSNFNMVKDFDEIATKVIKAEICVKWPELIYHKLKTAHPQVTKEQFIALYADLFGPYGYRTDKGTYRTTSYSEDGLKQLARRHAENLMEQINVQELNKPQKTLNDQNVTAPVKKAIPQIQQQKDLPTPETPKTPETMDNLLRQDFPKITNTDKGVSPTASSREDSLESHAEKKLMQQINVKEPNKPQKALNDQNVTAPVKKVVPQIPQQEDLPTPEMSRSPETMYNLLRQDFPKLTKAVFLNAYIDYRSFERVKIYLKFNAHHLFKEDSLTGITLTSCELALEDSKKFFNFIQISLNMIAGPMDLDNWRDSIFSLFTSIYPQSTPQQFEDVYTDLFGPYRHKKKEGTIDTSKYTDHELRLAVIKYSSSQMEKITESAKKASTEEAKAFKRYNEALKELDDLMKLDEFKQYTKEVKEYREQKKAHKEYIASNKLDIIIHEYRNFKKVLDGLKEQNAPQEQIDFLKNQYIDYANSQRPASFATPFQYNNYIYDQAALFQHPHIRDLKAEAREKRKAELEAGRAALTARKAAREERRAALAEKKAAIEKRKAEREEKKASLEEELAAFKSQSRQQQTETIVALNNKLKAIIEELAALRREFNTENDARKKAMAAIPHEDTEAIKRQREKNDDTLKRLTVKREDIQSRYQKYIDTLTAFNMGHEETLKDSYTPLDSQKSGESTPTVDLTAIYKEFITPFKNQDRKQQVEFLKAFITAIHENYLASSKELNTEIEGNNSHDIIIAFHKKRSENIEKFSKTLVEGSSTNESSPQLDLIKKCKAFLATVNQAPSREIFLTIMAIHNDFSSLIEEIDSVNNGDKSQEKQKEVAIEEPSNHPNANAFLELEKSDESTPTADPMAIYNEYITPLTKQDRKQQVEFLKALGIAIYENYLASPKELNTEIEASNSRDATIAFLKKRNENIEKFSKTFVEKLSTNESSPKLDLITMCKAFVTAVNQAPPIWRFVATESLSLDFSSLLREIDTMNDGDKSQEKQKEVAIEDPSNPPSTGQVARKSLSSQEKTEDSHTSLGSPRSYQSIK